MVTILALAITQVQSTFHEIIVFSDRRFENVQLLPQSLKELNKIGTEKFCQKNKLRLVLSQGGSITVVPRVFAGLDFYEDATITLNHLIEAKAAKDIVHLDKLSEGSRKSIVDLIQSSTGRDFQVTGDESCTLTFGNSIEFRVGSRTISLDSEAESPEKTWKKVFDLQDKPFVRKPRESPKPNDAKSSEEVRVFAPSLEVTIVTEKPVFTKERLAITSLATKIVSEFVDAQMALNREAVSKALASLGHPEKDGLGGSVPSGGDVNSLPEATRNDLHQQITGSWKSLGFSSADDAESFWKQASISNVKTQAFLSYGVATSGSTPGIGSILLGRN